MGAFYIPSKGEEDWRNLLADREKQWQPGYSAMELAASWEKAKGFPACVQHAFQTSEHELFKDVTFLYGFPEYKVPLPGGSTSSQNDLYVLAKSGDELLTVMIEGKVSEPFGETVEAWLGDNPSTGKMERLDYLLKKLDLADIPLNTRYQLLHRTASAVIEASKVQAKNALMLVHSFSETGKWYDDYVEFVKMFQVIPKKDAIVGPVLVNGIHLYFGWVTGEKQMVDTVNLKEANNLPNNLRGRSIHLNVIPTVCNLKNTLKKLKEVHGDVSQLKQWEKRSYQAYHLEKIKMELLELNQVRQIELIRNHILNHHPADLGASCIDIYLVAFVAENYGTGKNTFFNYIKTSGISDKENTAQAIWQVGKGDGLFLNILNEDGTVKDWQFLNRWMMG